jgi:hypothetical protein
MVWEPAVEAGTTKVALQAPRPLAEIPEVTAVPSKVIVMPVSLAPKPEPVTVIEVPGGPLVRLRVMAPPSTVKVTPVTKLARVLGPYAPIVWEPAVEAGIVKVALQFPRESAWIPDLTTVPSKVIIMPVSLAAKPEPVTVTEVPGDPLARLRAMTAFTTVKVTPGTEPARVLVPYAPIVWEPAVEVGTTKVPLQLSPEPTGIPEVTLAPSKVIVMFSLATKLKPVTVTELPGGPLVRLIVM